MNLKLFITGTDTDVGKTYVSKSLIHSLNNLGFNTLGMKPIASGCNNINGKLINDDALQLQNTSSIKLKYNKINPIAFEPPVAPNIAADKINQRIELSKLSHICKQTLNYKSDITVIEGVGGWYVPINKTESMADFVIKNNLSVILVVGIKLGCLNHAILTYKAILDSKVPFLGWIANCIDPNCLEIEKNIETLKTWIKKPCLDVINYKDEISLSSIKKIVNL